MKKILILIIVLAITNGCSQIYKKSNELALDEILNEKSEKIVIFRSCPLLGTALEIRVFINGEQIEKVDTCQLITLEKLKLKDTNEIEVRFSKSHEFFSKFSHLSNPLFQEVLPSSWEGDLVKRVGDNIVKNKVKCGLLDCSGVDYEGNILSFKKPNEKESKYFLIHVNSGAKNVDIIQFTKDEFLIKYKQETNYKKIK